MPAARGKRFGAAVLVAPRALVVTEKGIRKLGVVGRGQVQRANLMLRGLGA